jgi:hypothetical protein
MLARLPRGSRRGPVFPAIGLIRMLAVPRKVVPWKVVPRKVVPWKVAP